MLALGKPTASRKIENCKAGSFNALRNTASDVWGFRRGRGGSYTIQMSEAEKCSHCQAGGCRGGLRLSARERWDVRRQRWGREESARKSHRGKKEQDTVDVCTHACFPGALLK